MPWYTRWRNVFRSEPLNRELDNEFVHHLAELSERLESEGMEHEEALRSARLRLGNYSLQKEKTRDMNIASWLDQTRADFQYALRQLRLSPGFTAVAVISLMLGIGANTAIFQLINALRLKVLPVKDPGELALINFAKGAHRSGWGSSRNAEFTYSQWQQLQAEHQPFQDVIAWSAARFNLTNGGVPRFAEGLYASGDFFRALGVPSILGRTFGAADDSSSCNAGAVLSYAFWQREFGGSLQAIGRTISLDGHGITVIGVTPPSFYGVEVGSRYDVALPLCADTLLSDADRHRIGNRTAWWLSMMGRLKPGWTPHRATAWLRTVSPQIMRATLPAEYNPDFAKLFLKNTLVAASAARGVSALRDEYERPLYLLLAISGLVLLIACANLANLLLARATVREGEIAVRLALGASRERVVRQFLAESLLLALSGTALGAALALVFSRSLIALIGSSQDAIFLNADFDWRVLAFACGLALLTCLLFGLLPALRATRMAPASAMRAGGRTATTSRERFSIRRSLVVFQVALSLVLLFGSLLFVRSFRNLLTTAPGFRAEGILTVSIDFGKASIAKTARLATARELEEKLAAIPGVRSAAQIFIPPMSGLGWNQDIGLDGAPAAASNKQTFLNRSSPGYFRTMQTRLVAGREFNDHDTLGSAKVAIVNEQFAKQYFPHVNPVGHSLRLDAPAGKPEPQFQIVGVVENTKYYDLREDFRPIVFVPVAQDDDPRAGCRFVLRIAAAPSSVMQQAKAAAASMSPLMGIDFHPLSQDVADSMLRERLMATLSAAFGILAALLATLGLYGVMSYMVERRRKEIGIRMALGADRGGVIRLVLREAALLAIAGLCVGAILSFWAGQLAGTLLYDIKPRDPISLIAAAVLLAVVALLAGFIPARRAAGNDPMQALRIE